MQTGSNRQQSFASSGLADQGDQLDIIVKQHIESKLLLSITRMDTPQTVARSTHQRHGLTKRTVVATQCRM